MAHGAWQKYRTIVEVPGVSQALDQARAQHPRLDDAWQALTWLLCRRADVLGLQRVVGTTRYHLYRQGPDPVANTPGIAVVYWTDPDQVHVVGVRIV